MTDELDIVRWIVKQSPAGRGNVVVGPGDDAAVLAPSGDDEIVFTIDEVVEGVHFRLEGDGPGPKATPAQVGFKAHAISVSDLAAMGARPLGAVAALSLRSGQKGIVKSIYRGLTSSAAKTSCPLVGGNITGTPGPMTMSVAAIGAVPRGGAFLRSGARPGDAIFVTGRLGGSILGRHLKPEPRFAEAAFLRTFGGVSAMMDVSDGLALDLSRMLEASGAGARLDAAGVPVSAAARKLARQTGKRPLDHALGDGEDFELLFTMNAAHAVALEAAWRFKTKLSRIGMATSAASGLEIAEAGVIEKLEPEGFRHL